MFAAVEPCVATIKQVAVGVCRGAHPDQIAPLELKPVVPGGIGFLQAKVQVQHIDI